MIRRKFFPPFNRYRFKLKNVRRRFNERRESIKFNQVKKKDISYSSAKAINATDYFWSIYVHVYKLGIFQELQLVTTKKLISQTSRYRCSRMGWARTMMDVFHSRTKLHPVSDRTFYPLFRQFLCETRAMFRCEKRITINWYPSKSVVNNCVSFCSRIKIVFTS